MVMSSRREGLAVPASPWGFKKCLIDVFNAVERSDFHADRNIEYSASGRSDQYNSARVTAKINTRTSAVSLTDGAVTFTIHGD